MPTSPSAPVTAQRRTLTSAAVVREILSKRKEALISDGAAGGLKRDPVIPLLLLLDGVLHEALAASAAATSLCEFDLVLSMQISDLLRSAT